MDERADGRTDGWTDGMARLKTCRGMKSNLPAVYRNFRLLSNSGGKEKRVAQRKMGAVSLRQRPVAAGGCLMFETTTARAGGEVLSVQMMMCIASRKGKKGRKRRKREETRKGLMLFINCF